METCIFCKIRDGELPSAKVYEDEFILAFQDIHPQAPVHVVVIPKKHIRDVVEMTQEGDLAKRLLDACVKVAELKGIKDEGFRLIHNCGESAGQTVMHMHMHVLGGTSFGEGIV